MEHRLSLTVAVKHFGVELISADVGVHENIAESLLCPVTTKICTRNRSIPGDIS